MSYSYDAGSTTPGHSGLLEIASVIRLNSAIPTGGSTAGGTFKLEPGCALFGTAPVRLPTSALPSDHGASIGTPFLDGWAFNVPGWLWVPSGPDDCPAAAEQLKAAFSPLNGLLTLILNKRGWSTRRQITAQTNGEIGAFEARHGSLLTPTRNFTIPMFAPDPLIYDADNLKTIDLPMDGTSHSVTNSGNAATPMVARFTGPFTSSATLTLVGSGKTLVYAATILAGNYADVQTNSAAPGGISAISNVGGNIFQWLGTQTLLMIPPGTSTFTATASGGTTVASKITLTWRDAFG